MSGGRDNTTWSNAKLARELHELNQLRVALLKSISLQPVWNEGTPSTDKTGLFVSNPIPPVLQGTINIQNAQEQLDKNTKSDLSGYEEFIQKFVAFCQHIKDVDEEELKREQEKLITEAGEEQIDNVDLLQPDWELTADGEDEHNEKQTVSVFIPLADQASASPQPFAGYSGNAPKTAGANHPGPYGGIWKSDTDGTYAMFKRDTVEVKGSEKIRVGKIIGEYVAGQVIADLLIEMNDAEYAKKYVADVTLVKADRSDAKETDADLVYLKSTFLPNYVGDYWKVAFVEAFEKEILQQIPEDKVTDTLKENAHKLAELRVKALIGDDKPKAVKQALLGKYDDPVINTPSQALLSHEDTWLNNFCQQVAARLIVSDYGIHPGNFGVVQYQDEPSQIASLDYGAALLKLKDDVSPYSRLPKKTGTKPYKNHLLEYRPEVIKHEKMAQAFIKAGNVSADSITRMVDKILSAENIPYESPKHIAMFCKRMGMPKADYEKINDKTQLLAALKKFLIIKFNKRRSSMLKLGYGLQLEHWVKQSKSKQDLKNRLATAEPGLKDFIKNDLKDYQPTLLTKRQFVKKDIQAAYTKSQPVPASNKRKASVFDPSPTDDDLSLTDDLDDQSVDTPERETFVHDTKRIKLAQEEFLHANIDDLNKALVSFTQTLDTVNQRLDGVIKILEARNEKLMKAGTKRKAPMDDDTRVSKTSVFAPRSSQSKDSTDEPQQKVHKRS